MLVGVVDVAVASGTGAASVAESALNVARVCAGDSLAWKSAKALSWSSCGEVCVLIASTSTTIAATIVSAYVRGFMRA